MKNYTEFPTFKRYMNILDILKSWGPLERKDMEQWLKNRMDLEHEENIEKALRRDLKTLVQERELDEFAFNKQGILLGKSMEEDFTERVRFYKYQVAGKDELQVSGKNELEEAGGRLHYSPGMEHFLRLKKGEHAEEYNRFVLYFELFNELFHLEIDLKTLTLARAGEWVNLLVAGNRQVREKDLNKITEEYGPYCVVLLLNDPFLSSPSKEIPSHFRISFQQKGRIIIEDLGSKNGTEYASIDEFHCNELLSDLTFNHDKTKTRYWTDREEAITQPLIAKNAVTGDGDRFLIKAKNAGFIFQS